MAFEISDEYTLEVLFTAAECEQIKNCGTGNWYNAEFKINDAENFSTDPQLNSGQMRDVNLTQLNAILNSKNLPSVSYAKLEKYDITEFFADHSDCNIDEKNEWKTIVVWLSDPSQYAGGDFLIRETALDRSQGNVLQKQSWLRNSVATVNAGTVYYLIAAYTA